MRRFLLLAVVASLSACATNPAPPPEVVYKEKDIPVAVGCIVGKPYEVVPLNKSLTSDQWAALPVGSKAEQVHAQAGARMNYEDRLKASQAGCTPAPIKN